MIRKVHLPKALKKYPFSLQHTFSDPSKLASLKIHKLALRVQTCEFFTLRSPRRVPQKIYAIRSQGYFFSLFQRARLNHQFFQSFSFERRYLKYPCPAGGVFFITDIYLFFVLCLTVSCCYRCWQLTQRIFQFPPNDG